MVVVTVDIDGRARSSPGPRSSPGLGPRPGGRGPPRRVRRAVRSEIDEVLREAETVELETLQRHARRAAGKFVNERTRRKPTDRPRHPGGLGVGLGPARFFGSIPFLFSGIPPHRDNRGFPLAPSILWSVLSPRSDLATKRAIGARFGGRFAGGFLAADHAAVVLGDDERRGRGAAAGGATGPRAVPLRVRAGRSTPTAPRPGAGCRRTSSSRRASRTRR